MMGVNEGGGFGATAPSVGGGLIGLRCSGLQECSGITSVDGQRANEA